MIRVLAIVVLSVVGAHAEWQVAQGYRVEEYAREPRVVDPMAMDWDGQGRLHVLESGGRIKILGQEPTVIAEDLAGATGLAIRGDKIFVARAPELLVIEGTNRQVLIRDLPQPGVRGNINSLTFGLMAGSTLRKAHRTTPNSIGLERARETRSLYRAGSRASIPRRSESRW